MSQPWYYQLMGEDVGPLSGAELREHVRDGRVTRDVLVRREGSDRWVLADTVAGLFDPPPIGTVRRGTASSVRGIAPSSDSTRQGSSAYRAGVWWNRRIGGTRVIPEWETRRDQYLNELRNSSAYSVLRFLIDILILLGLVVTAIAGLISLIGVIVLLFGSAEGIPEILFYLVVMAIVAPLLIAARQSALLVIDIADTLLFEHSSKPPASKAGGPLAHDSRELPTVN